MISTEYVGRHGTPVRRVPLLPEQMTLAQDIVIPPDFTTAYVHTRSALKVLGVFIAVLIVCMLVVVGMLVISYRKTK